MQPANKVPPGCAAGLLLVVVGMGVIRAEPRMDMVLCVISLFARRYSSGRGHFSSGWILSISHAHFGAGYCLNKLPEELEWMEVETQILLQADLISWQEGAALTLLPGDKKDGLDTSR